MKSIKGCHKNIFIFTVVLIIIPLINTSFLAGDATTNTVAALALHQQEDLALDQQEKEQLLALEQLLAEARLALLSGQTQSTKKGKPSLCLNSLSLDGDLVVHGVICCDNPSEGCFGTEVVTQFEPPLANNDFACTRAGEGVVIDILANDVPGTNPIDPATVTILKDPDHAFAFSVNPINGEVTYVADTRFVGQDEFAYTVSDTAGNPSPHIATVTVDVRCEPADTPNPRFIYSNDQDIYQYNGGASTHLTTTDRGPNVMVNALATNRDDNLIYYAWENFIYAYDYIADVHFTVVNVATDPRFTAYTDLSDGGATYVNGVYYVAGSGDNPGYYRVAFDPYVPGSFAQTISSVYFIVWSDGLDREMSDMQYDPISGNLVVCSSITGGGADRTVSIITPDSGVVLKLSPFPVGPPAMPVNMQIALGPDNVFYINPEYVGFPDTTVRILNPSDGQFVNQGGVVFTNLVARSFDMAEYICQPCDGLGTELPLQPGSEIGTEPFGSGTGIPNVNME